jgi:hypothetical protein
MFHVSGLVDDCSLLTPLLLAADAAKSKINQRQPATLKTCDSENDVTD